MQRPPVPVRELLLGHVIAVVLGCLFGGVVIVGGLRRGDHFTDGSTVTALALAPVLVLLYLGILLRLDLVRRIEQVLLLGGATALTGLVVVEIASKSFDPKMLKMGIGIVVAWKFCVLGLRRLRHPLTVDAFRSSVGLVQAVREGQTFEHAREVVVAFVLLGVLLTVAFVHAYYKMKLWEPPPGSSNLLMGAYFGSLLVGSLLVGLVVVVGLVMLVARLTRGGKSASTEELAPDETTASDQSDQTATRPSNREV